MEGMDFGVSDALEAEDIDKSQFSLENNTGLCRPQYCNISECLKDYKNKLIEKGFLSNSGKWKLFGLIPWRYATNLELKKLLIEEIATDWYTEPKYDVDSPDFDEHLYRRYVECLLQQIGDPMLPLSITFKNVSVRVPVYTKPAINNILIGLQKMITDPFHKLTWLLLPKSRKDKEMHFILENTSGTVLPGEMLLVLGPPESGKSTFLRALAYQLDSNCETSGEVYYGRSVYSPEIKHRIHFVDQEDYHMASLSVRDTLEFATKCCIPDYVPFAERIRQDQLKIVTRELKLAHVLNTPLGNHKIRGVSGGEKKRVTVAEILAGKMTPISLLDNITRGLDAAVALEILRYFRSLADIHNEIFVCTMQQLSDEMYNLFDKVLVLDEGKCLFIGKTTQAVEYFDSIGFKKPESRSIPEFLCSISEPAAFQTIVKQGWEAKAPRTLNELRESFLQSHCGTQDELFVSQNACETESAITRTTEENEIHKLYQKNCLQSLTSQLKLLIHRQIKIERKNKPALIARAIRYIMMSLIMGALFWQTKPTELGAQIYPGILFIAIITVGLGSMKTLSDILDSRAVFDKHRSNHFYNAFPLVLSQALIELPICFLESLIFSSILYFMVGLNEVDGARRYGFLVLCMFVLDISMASLVRFIGFSSSSIHVSNAISNGLLVIFVVFAGFVVPKKHIGVWWIWLFWLSPFNYLLDAAIINQYAGLDLYCTTDELIPLEAPLQNRICPLEFGTNYISHLFGVFTTNIWKWLDILIVLSFYFFFLILSVCALEYVKFSYKAYIRPQKDKDSTIPAEKQDTVDLHGMLWIKTEESSASITMSQLDPVEMDKQEEFQGLSFKTEDNSSSSVAVKAMKNFFVHDIPFPKVIFTWKNLCYYVPVSKKDALDNQRTIHMNGSKRELQLLDHIDGYAVPGKLMALFGASGTGKTTLLDVLSDRKTTGRTTGEIKINRKPRNKFFRRIAGYIEQQDIHDDRITVREALEFSARLRQPREVSDEEKLLSVESVLDMLHLREIQHRLVGSSNSQNALMITPEARKRVTIGVELVSRSSILFLDEPTSGLDCRAAWLVMRTVRKVADTGRTVICTIHQPSTELFEMFDEILLLHSGGRICYLGPLGAGSCAMIKYFVDRGANPPYEKENPADWVLELVSRDEMETTKPDSINWVKVWNQSAENAKIRNMLERYERSTDGHSISMDKLNHLEPTMETDTLALLDEQTAPIHFQHYMASSFMQQLVVVVRRSFLQYWRMPEYNLVRLVLNICAALLMGSAFYHVPRTQLGTEIAVGVVFLIAIFTILSVTAAIHPVEHQREVFYKETASGTYYPLVYWMGMFLQEIPYNLLATSILIVIFYFLVGFPPHDFGYFFLSYIILSFVATSFGQCIAIFSPNEQVSQLIAPVFSSLMLVLAGFIIPKPAIPNYMIWLYWANPYSYAVDSLASAVWHHETFTCTAGERYAFPLPADATQCSTYSASFIESSDIVCKSYLNSTVTDNCCLFCRYTDGNQFLSEFGFEFSTYWTYVGALIAYYIGFQFIAAIGIQFVRYIRR
eukprot:jgi/Galph1/3034/GphlegSOOS_G1687.1